MSSIVANAWRKTDYRSAYCILKMSKVLGDVAVNSSTIKMFRSDIYLNFLYQSADLAAQRLKWRAMVKRQVHEFEKQRRSGLAAKRGILKIRPPTVIYYNYVGGILTCRV